MDRRQFIHIITSIGAVSMVQPRLSYAQAGNPKVYLFGMFLIDNSSAAIRVRVPQLDGMDQHRAFMAASNATIKTFGGPVIAVNQQTGLHLMHTDYAVTQFPAAMPLGQSAASLSGGAGPTIVQQSLLDRLPSLSALSAQAGGPQRAVTMPSGSFDIALSGGQLRLPARPSTSPGSDSAVRWQIAVNGANAGSPMALTDMSVFESSARTLTIAIGGNSVSLNGAETVWIFNLPLLKAVDKTPKEIEHIAESAQLLSPPLGTGTLKATTTFSLVHGSSGPFNHPNLTLPGVRQSASAYFAKMHPGAVASGFPPDTDICMQFRS